MQLGKGLSSKIVSLHSFIIKFKSLPAINQSLSVVATLKANDCNVKEDSLFEVLKLLIIVFHSFEVHIGLPV